MTERNLLLLGSLVFTTCLFLVTTILGILALTPDGAGLFPKGTEAISEHYKTQFTPYNWVNTLFYSLIYCWMTLAYVYGCLNIFRMSVDGPMYCNPVVITVETCAVFSISYIFHIIYLFLWAHEKLVATAVVLAVLSIVNWSALILFSIRLWSATAMLHHDAPLDLWCYRILFQNGLATYATWTTLDFFIKFGSALGESEATIVDGHPHPAAVSIILVTFFISLWTSLELMVWDRYFRYILTPLIIILWLLSSVYGRLRFVTYQDETVRVYSLVLICIVAILVAGRLALVVVKHIYMPLVKIF